MKHATRDAGFFAAALTKFCPVGGELYAENFKYCPIHGVELRHKDIP